MDSLVSVQWLAEHLDDPELRVLDATVQVRRRRGLPTVRSGKVASGGADTSREVRSRTCSTWRTQAGRGGR